MNTYELTVIVPEDKEGKEVARIVKLVTDFAKKTKGAVKKHESWGSKQLAYLIKKHKTAQYEHFVLELEASSQVELDKTLRLDETILRYMFIKTS